MTTCGWCGTHYTLWKNRCDSCGGPMPPLPGQELGEPPPPAPRKLPAGFAFRLRWSGNIATIIGTVFFIFGGLILKATMTVKPWASLFPLAMMLGAFSVFRYGWSHASAVLRAFRRGTAVKGEVLECRIDTTQSVNNQHPFKLTWQFSADGHSYEGSLTSFDSTLGSRARGQPLWVLYVPEDPGQNTVYPPLK